jgi:hypothetical protein
MHSWRHAFGGGTGKRSLPVQEHAGGTGKHARPVQLPPARLAMRQHFPYYPRAFLVEFRLPESSPGE